MNRSPHLLLAQNYWKEHLRPQAIVIDATCGNGQDTLILARLTLKQEGGLLIGLDIQETALRKTQEMLESSEGTDVFQKTLFERRCHSEIDQIPLPHAPDLIVYNLGYLPGGDKSITTKTQTTLVSLHKATKLLSERGALSVMCYPGHEEGKQEEEAILAWARALFSHKWQVSYHCWINRCNAPSFLWIQRACK